MRSGSCICIGDFTIKVDRDSRGSVAQGCATDSGSSPNLATDHITFSALCLPFGRGMGMSMPLAVPVLSGKYNGTCVSTAPAAEPSEMSFSSLCQEAPWMRLQLSCSHALSWQTALSLRLHCAARVLASPCRVMVHVSLLMVLFMA